MIDSNSSHRVHPTPSMTKKSDPREVAFFDDGAGDGNRTRSPSPLSDQSLTASGRATKWFPKWFLGRRKRSAHIAFASIHEFECGPNQPSFLLG